jgi:hypothetical protein
MNNNFQKSNQNPHKPTLFRVGEKVFDKDWNEYEVKHRKNWHYVVINREQVGVSKLQDKEGYSEPVYFNYVFGGGYMNGNNSWYDRLLNIATMP